MMVDRVPIKACKWDSTAVAVPPSFDGSAGVLKMLFRLVFFLAMLTCIHLFY